MMEKKVEKEILLCDHCSKKVSYGGDVISVEKCVNGPRGVIPLGEVFRFCTEDCVSRFFDHEPVTDLPRIPRRIP